MLGDVIGQFITEVLLLGLGKAVAAIFLPAHGWEGLHRMRTQSKTAKAGFSYERNGRRYLYLQSLQLLGLLALLVLGLLIFAGVYCLP